MKVKKKTCREFYECWSDDLFLSSLKKKKKKKKYLGRNNTIINVIKLNIEMSNQILSLSNEKCNVIELLKSNIIRELKLTYQIMLFLSSEQNYKFDYNMLSLVYHRICWP